MSPSSTRARIRSSPSNPIPGETRPRSGTGRLSRSSSPIPTATRTRFSCARCGSGRPRATISGASSDPMPRPPTTAAPRAVAAKHRAAAVAACSAGCSIDPVPRQRARRRGSRIGASRRRRHRRPEGPRARRARRASARHHRRVRQAGRRPRAGQRHHRRSAARRRRRSRRRAARPPRSASITSSSASFPAAMRNAASKRLAADTRQAAPHSRAVRRRHARLRRRRARGAGSARMASCSTPLGKSAGSLARAHLLHGPRRPHRRRQGQGLMVGLAGSLQARHVPSLLALAARSARLSRRALHRRRPQRMPLDPDRLARHPGPDPGTAAHFHEPNVAERVPQALC